MSYVLDALRRAEADRHRGQVPDLHAPPAPALGGRATGGRPAGTTWGWMAVALVLALGVAAAVWWGLGWQGSPPAPLPPTPVTGSAAPAESDRAVPHVPVEAVAPVDAGPVPPPVALPAVEPPRRAAARAPAGGDDAAGGNAVPRDLPPLVFGGAFDSPDPRARMLIINGQLWREGDEPTPGLQLERIALHAAQFRYRGRSFELPYDAPRGAARP